MSSATNPTALQDLKQNWLWFMVMGGFLMILGFVIIGWAVFATIVTMEILGWLLLFGGVLQTLHALFRKGWSGVFVEILSGVLAFLLGLMIVSTPTIAAVILTFLIAVALMLEGIFRLVVALTQAVEHRLVLILNGVVSLMLGIAIWQQWPVSGLWAIGMFVGVHVVFNGLSLVMVALFAKGLPELK